MGKPPAEIVDALEDADDETLQSVIDFCRLELDSEDIDDKPEPTAADSDPPDEWEGDAEQWSAEVADCEAPARATTTVKTIKGNQYIYFQWSEDGKTKSEYVAPVNPKQ